MDWRNDAPKVRGSRGNATNGFRANGFDFPRRSREEDDC